MNKPAPIALRPIRDGHAWKNGKLYAFCRRDGILVIKGWPELKAWRKTPKGKSFYCCRPEIRLDAGRLSAARQSRSCPPPTVSALQSYALDPSPDEKNLLEDIEKYSDPAFSANDWREVNLVLQEPDLGEITPEISTRFAEKMRRISLRKLSDLRALTAFAETFPPEVRQPVSSFGSRQWQLARLAKLAGGLELIHSNPGLAFAIANSWVFRKNTKPTRTAQRLLKVPRRMAAGWLGFPATESAVKQLGKIPASACFVSSILNLRRSLTGGVREDLSGALKHLPVLNADALMFINSHRIERVATVRLLRDITLKAEHDGGVGTWLEYIRDIRRMEFMLGHNNEARPIYSLAGLSRYHDAVTAEYSERFGAEDETTEDLTTPLPAPPLPGTDHIVPLIKPQEILEEALKMKHCVLSYLESIREGHSYVYRVLAPERATLEIRPHGGQWVLAQLCGFKNAKPGQAVRMTVENWLAGISLNC